ncbi:MAG: ABC transporter ATP-binding protein [Magnetospirillum sp. WYHS-4]
MDAVLSIVDLTVAFPTAAGPAKAADGLSFDLRPGCTTALVGESGCGKSVTALALMGLVPPPGRLTGGSIRFAGRDLTNLTEREWRKLRGAGLAMVFQEPLSALNPVMTIGDQVAEAFRLHARSGGHTAWAETVAMLGRVGIPDPAARAKAYPHQLSGGMRQRAMLAMALVCRPAVLLADEPTTALDVTVQAQIIALMQDMQQELGTAILFISHDLGAVSAIADDVLVMYAGRIVERAPAGRLFAHPLHPYTRGLLDTLPGQAPRHGRLPSLDGAVPDLARLPEGCRFSDRCPLADAVCRDDEPPLADHAGCRVACWKARP